MASDEKRIRQHDLRAWRRVITVDDSDEGVSQQGGERRMRFPLIRILRDFVEIKFTFERDVAGTPVGPSVQVLFFCRERTMKAFVLPQPGNLIVYVLNGFGV